MSNKNNSGKKTREPQLAYNVMTLAPIVKARPFVKWAGGKSQLLPAYVTYLPSLSQIQRYFEPFLGGAAVFFYLQPEQAFLSDSNAELINLYSVVQDRVEELIVELTAYQNDEDFYYAVRSKDPGSLTPIQNAARFIYLNKTCYNGLYRVNSSGQFNVPFGRYVNPTICDAEVLRSASLALSGVSLTVADFEKALSSASARDFIYFDPPYHPVTKTSSFTSYTMGKFGDDEQHRLARIFKELDQKGCLVMLSNSDTPLIRELYKAYKIIEIQANRAINSNPEKRGKITELLIINYGR